MSVRFRGTFRFFATIVVLSTVCLTGRVIAHEVVTNRNHEITAAAMLASDYVFRGVTQTQDGPAVPVAFGFSDLNGLFAGVRGSNVDLQDGGTTAKENNLEIDIYVSCDAGINDDWSVVDANRYILPGTAKGSDLDWNKQFLRLDFRESVSFLVAYSDVVFSINEGGIYYSAGFDADNECDVIPIDTQLNESGLARSSTINQSLTTLRELECYEPFCR